jgi:diguanylate cyclase (GGDEF)-like protein/PAS domain S-box-containing protein
MEYFDKRMALEVLENTLSGINTPHDCGLATGLCGAFYMCGLLSKKEWASFLKRIPAKTCRGNTYRIGGIKNPGTKIKRVEEKLRLAATVLETINEAVIVTDQDNRIISVNPAFAAITGYSLEDVIGKDPHILSSDSHPAKFYKQLWKSLDTTGSWSGEIWNRRKTGEVYVEWLSIKQIRDEKGNITHHVGMFYDISKRKATEENLERRAHYDFLTGLPNRFLFADRLHQAMAVAKREKGHLALMYLDLDKFKPVNDQHGHHTGDLLLKEAAKRLLECVRESDTVSRIGGDEFLVLLPVTEEKQDALVVAEKILLAFNKPFEIEGQNLQISSSIGIAFYPEHGSDEKLLIEAADSAMYQAKKSGRNNVQVFRHEINGISSSLLPAIRPI